MAVRANSPPLSRSSPASTWVGEIQEKSLRAQEEVVVEDDVLEDVEDEVQDVDVEGDLDEVEDAVHNVPADGKVLFCDAVVEEVVVEPPLGDVFANPDVGGKMPD